MSGGAFVGRNSGRRGGRHEGATPATRTFDQEQSSRRRMWPVCGSQIGNVGWVEVRLGFWVSARVRGGGSPADDRSRTPRSTTRKCGILQATRAPTLKTSLTPVDGEKILWELGTMKPILGRLGLVAAIIVSLAACSGDSGSGSSPTGPSSPLTAVITVGFAGCSGCGIHEASVLLDDVEVIRKTCPFTSGCALSNWITCCSPRALHEDNTL